MTTLLAVPNVSEGRDADRLAALERAFSTGAQLLDRHTDADHDRTVLTLAGEGEALRRSLLSGAAAAIEAIDMAAYDGLHPAIGALDVCPLVWLDPVDREAALAEARTLADEVAALEVPVFLYGELASEPERRRARLLPPRRAGRAPPADGDGRAASRPGAGRAAPQRRRHSDHRPAAAGRLQRRARLSATPRSRGPSRPNCASRAAACLGFARSGSRSPPGAARSRPTSTTRSRSRSALSSSRSGSSPRRSAPDRSRRSSSALSLPAALLDYPTDVPIRGFDPDQHTIERRLAAAND